MPRSIVIPPNGSEFATSVTIRYWVFGLLLGLCTGIMITITNPDGSKTIMYLSSGSKVEVSEEPVAAAQSPAKTQSHAQPAAVGDEQLLYGLVQSAPSSVPVLTPQEAFKNYWKNPFGASLADPPSAPDARGKLPVEKATQSMNNLKYIGLSFHNFYDANRKFPGSSNRREGAYGISPGQQTFPFSWRVAILPFIEQSELFEQYRFYEPWDSERNLSLLDKMPDVYRSPFADAEQPRGETNYVGFAGDQTALGTGGGMDLMRACTDGIAFTLLIVETENSVPWTKPADLPFSGKDDAQRATPSDPTNNALYYLTADGAPHKMQPVDWDLLAKLITRDGGEVVKLE